jgi:dipeptidyl aminopeptidase/acylaminoacyl peptidase
MNRSRLLSFLAAALLALNAHAAPDRSGPLVQHPAVSPSGTEVVFSADFDGSARIWAATLDGRQLRKLSSSPPGSANAADSEPRWSPDGRSIVYASSTGSGSEIWVMRADGSYPQKLTSLNATSTSPAWSPDGSRIIFISDKDGTRDIWSVNADGTRAMKLLTSAAEENRPGFSPGGEQIVFSRTEGETASLVVMSAAGANVRALTSGNFRDWEPHWGVRGIVADVAGHDPTWLPDGRLILTDETLSTRAVSGLSVVNPASGTRQAVVDVQGYSASIDVRPGKATNHVNHLSSGRIMVAVLSNGTFNAPLAVVQRSLTFGRTGSEASFAYCSTPHKDVNGDGIPDLSCRFSTRLAGFHANSATGVLRFVDIRGIPREGRDSITVVTQDDPDDFKD